MRESSAAEINNADVSNNKSDSTFTFLTAERRDKEVQVQNVFHPPVQRFGKTTESDRLPNPNPYLLAVRYGSLAQLFSIPFFPFPLCVSLSFPKGPLDPFKQFSVHSELKITLPVIALLHKISGQLSLPSLQGQ